MSLLDIIKKGSTDRSITLRIIDDTDGTPETAVVYNTAGIDLWYRREGAAKTSITEATLAALTTTHTDGGFLHISNGEYRFDIPDAAFATGVNHVDFGGTVTGMVVIGGRIRLVDYDLEDGVRLGLTSLANAAAGAAGGLPTDSTGKTSFNDVSTAQVNAEADIAISDAALATSANLAIVDTVADAIKAVTDLLPNAGALSDLAILVARLTTTRAGYLDKLNISGNVAASSEVTAIQNNTRVRVIVPPMIERPDSGSTAYKLHLYIYDEAGNMEAPDSAPTLTVVNETGTSRAANLGTVTLESVGHYSVTYTVADSHAIEQLMFEWTVTEGAVARLHGAASQIVDTTAVDFTSADRTALNGIQTDLDNGTDGLGALKALIDALNDFDPAVTPVEILASGGTAGGKTAAELVVDFWSDVLTTYTDGMAGKRLKSITAVPVDEGTVNDAGATTTTFITTLTGYANNHFQDALLSVEIATDQWQSKPVLSYNGTTGQFVLSEALTSAPANGVNVAARSTHVHPVSEIVSALLTTAMTEGYAADGVVPTLEQCLFMMMQGLSEFSYAGVTKNTKKLDKATTAMTHTLDDAVNPTSQTRAT